MVKAMSTACVVGDYTTSKMKYKSWKEDALKVCDDEEDIQGKIAIVTGSNTGLGKAVASQLAKRGAVVVMGVRNLEKGAEAVEDIKKEIGNDAKLELIQLDLCHQQSVRDFVKSFQSKYPQLHILVNNAGIMDTSGELKTTKDGLESHIGTNHLGPFLLTRLLLDSLRKGAPSRIVCVQTLNIAMAPFDVDALSNEPKLKTGDMYMEQYNMSKLFSAISMMKLSETLEGQSEKVKLFQLDPGLIKTNMLAGVNANMNIVMRTVNKASQAMIAVNTHQASETPVYLSVSKSLSESEDSGKGEIYRFTALWPMGNKLLKEYVEDERSTELYKKTEKMVGLGEE